MWYKELNLCSYVIFIMWIQLMDLWENKLIEQTNKFMPCKQLYLISYGFWIKFMSCKQFYNLISYGFWIIKLDINLWYKQLNLCDAKN